MWPPRKSEPQADSETLAKAPRKLRFNLFHRPKEIVGEKNVKEKPRKNESGRTAIRTCCAAENRPKVNLFPQVSLNDVRGRELDNVLDYMYSSDWKEAAAFSVTVSCMNLTTAAVEPTEVGPADVTNRFPDRFRRKLSQARPHVDLPRSEVDLVKWYKSFV